MTENHKENVAKKLFLKKIQNDKSPINMITDWRQQTAFI